MDIKDILIVIVIIGILSSYSHETIKRNNKIKELEEQVNIYNSALTLDYTTLARNYKLQFDSTQMYKKWVRTCHAS